MEQTGNRDYGLVALSETYALSREELMFLRGLGSRIFGTIRSSLPQLGVSIGITLPSLKITTLGEVLAALPGGIVFPVRLGVRAGGILAMNSQLKALAMQMVFGATREWNSNEPLTDLELATVGRLLGKKVARGFSAGFGGLFGAEATPTGAFSVEMMAQEALFAEDKVLTFSAQVDRGDSTMIAAIELSPLMAMRGRLKEAAKSTPLEPVGCATASKRVGEVKVELCAVLGTFETNFAYLRDIRPGSYIPLGRLRDSVATVDIYTGNRRLGTGVVVEDQGWRRVLIQDQA
jgi:flagellar motor switch protein FliM